MRHEDIYYTCDRCGNEMERFSKVPLRLKKNDDKIIDLCKDCKQAFIKFMNGADYGKSENQN